MTKLLSHHSSVSFQNHGKTKDNYETWPNQTPSWTFQNTKIIKQEKHT